jgi:hypothetical protein
MIPFSKNIPFSKKHFITLFPGFLVRFVHENHASIRQPSFVIRKSNDNKGLSLFQNDIDNDSIVSPTKKGGHANFSMIFVALDKNCENNGALSIETQ